MSLSTQSYESILMLASRYYNQHLPLYFANEHIDLVCNILLLLLQEKSLNIVQTTSILLEPIVENNNIIYISIPLLGLLINAPVELPKNTVEFVKDFDIFKGLDYGAKVDESRKSVFNFNGDSDDFTPSVRIRFMHMIRLVFACSHFYEHYQNKTPYTEHPKSINHLERAVQIGTEDFDSPKSPENQINYSILTL